MTIEIFSSEQPVEVETGQDLVAVALPESSLKGRLRNLGQTTLALVACSATILIGTESTAAETPSPPPPAIAKTGLKVGVATSSWYKSGFGKYTLFRNMATEGMSAVRLSYTDLPEVRAEVKAAIANGQEPIIDLPWDNTAQQDAQIAEQLPRVHLFDEDNEPNGKGFSDRTPGQALEHAVQDTRAIHAKRPSAKVLAFGLASGHHQVAYLRKISRIARRKYGNLNHVIDGVDIHEYRSLSANLVMLHADERIYSGPFYLNELGYIVDNPSAAGSVSLSKQAHDEATFITDIEQDPQVKTALFFEFKAMPGDPFDTANVSARNFRRPAYFALQAVLLNP